MKALVTGGTGFVGNNLARKLLSEKNKVGLLVREESKTWRIQDLLGKVDFLTGDLTNKEGLIRLIHDYKPEFIYHLGSYGTYPSFQKEIEKITSVNINGTLNLVEAAQKIPLINIGSSSEYGIKNCAMLETDKCHPDNLYGKTKLVQTLYCKEQEIPTLRIFSAYGPWQESSQLIPTLIKSKLNGNELHLIDSVRDYVYVEDIVNAILKATEKYDKIKGEIINLGSGKQYLTKDILNELDKIDSQQLKIKWDFNAVQTEPSVWVADISKAKRLLGWEPKILLEDGLRKTYNWFKENLGKNYDN